MERKNYGEIFRDLRLQKGISLNKLQKISGISKATLSQFENGNSLLSYDKLLQATKSLNITMYDYSLLVNGGTPEDFIVEFNNISQAYYNQDEVTLREIYLRNIEFDDEQKYIIGLCAKASYTELSPLEKMKIEKIMEFFPLWGLYELYVLLHTIEQLSIRTIDYLVSEFFSNESLMLYIKELREYRGGVLNIMIKIILFYIEEDERKKAEETLLRIPQFLIDSDITSKVMVYILEGLFIYKFEDKKRGTVLLHKGLDILEILGLKKLKNIVLSKIHKIKSYT